MASFYFTSGIRKAIGEDIQRARKQKKLKQVDVAAIAGVNRSYYGKIEKGLANPSIEKLYKIIKALDLKSSDVFPF
ncbi:helix-turn-helix domain-containing protein [Patescibacteria group bacterium]|nr:helix-turn-helix domain-containing protein [Patescibacteria group bacterium]